MSDEGKVDNVMPEAVSGAQPVVLPVRAVGDNTFLESETNPRLTRVARCLENLILGWNHLPVGEARYDLLRTEFERQIVETRRTMVREAGQGMLDSFNAWMSMTYPGLRTV